MIESIEGLYRHVADKFNLHNLYKADTGFYKILGAEVEFTSGVQHIELEEIVQQAISQGGIFGFYLDTNHLEIDEFIVAIGLDEQLLPYDEKNPDEFTEMIVIHELAHLIEQQDLLVQLEIELNNCDLAIGDKIEKHLSEPFPDLVHNKEFVAILNHLIRRVYADNHSHKLRVALSRTLIDKESDIIDSTENEDYYDCTAINNKKENQIDELNENIKSIQELKGFQFFVEDYQRGYKWGIQQVEELLNDVLEFEGGFESFYCLQPVVVKDLNNNEFELIDGQQRLTTIYIVLICLGQNTYELSYRTRTGSEEFLKDIKQLLGTIEIDVTQNIEKTQETLNAAWLKFIEVNNQYDNIDNYHFFSTYHFSNAWLKHINDKKNLFKKNLIESTKVIWYEQESEEDAESIFVKFNRGKIDLAQAELIKALFVLQLNQEKNIELRTFKLNQFAEEWNTIENELQDDSFWFFVSNDISDNRKSNRIDLLFDLIKEKSKKSNNKLYSYHLYLNQFSEHKKNPSLSLLNWSEVRDLFNQFFEWYQDRLLYHLIGFIIYEQIKTIAELNTSFQTSKDKLDFVKSLKKSINDFFNSKETKEKYDLDSISYGSDNSKITSWLVLHNVVNYHLTDNYYRFPFDRLKLQRGWSLEHIHAQKSDKLQSKPELFDWISDIEKLVDDFSHEDKFDDKTLIALKLALGDDDIQRDSKSIKDLEITLNDEISTYFQKDSIRNLCLLDRKTNSSIGNKNFSEKRSEILEIDKVSLEEYNKIYNKNETVKPFIPLATKHVFLKYFTKETDIQMALWGVNDREHYLNHIKTSINQFLATTDL